MGNEVTGKSGHPSQPPIPRTPAGNGTPAAGSGAAGNPRPAAAAARPAPAAAGSRTPAAAGGTQEKEKRVPELASVKSPAAVPAPEEPKKKQQRKPRKKKEEPQTFNADQLSALILSMSSIVASRPDMQIWQLSAAEANQLATPISNMIAKSEKLQNMGEYADAISLVTASMIIFAPRAFAQAELNKQKKIKNNGGVKLVRKDEERKVSGSDGKSAGTRPAPVPQHDSGFLAAVPAISY